MFGKVSSSGGCSGDSSCKGSIINIAHAPQLKLYNCLYVSVYLCVYVAVAVFFHIVLQKYIPFCLSHLCTT